MRARIRAKARPAPFTWMVAGRIAGSGEVSPGVTGDPGAGTRAMVGGIAGTGEVPPGVTGEPGVDTRAMGGRIAGTGEVTRGVTGDPGVGTQEARATGGEATPVGAARRDPRTPGVPAGDGTVTAGATGMRVTRGVTEIGATAGVTGGVEGLGGHDGVVPVTLTAGLVNGPGGTRGVIMGRVTTGRVTPAGTGPVARRAETHMAIPAATPAGPGGRLDGR
jgi:hypothetical protein